MKKLLSVLLMLSLVLGLAISASGETAVSQDKSDLFNGTFEGEGTGHNGPIKVSLTIEDNAITNIEVTDQIETTGLGDVALNTMIQEVIGKNSLEVDAVTGATISSKGFLDAVQDAFSKTGADPSILIAGTGGAALEEREAEYTADIIVIGAGGAGMTAAIEAVSNNAKVIVLEKLPVVGGNTLLSGGEMAAPQNWLQERDGIEDSADKMYEDTLKGGDNENDPALVRVLADHALEGATWLRDEINVTFEDYQLFFGGHSVERSLVPLNASGVELITKMSAKLAELEVPVHVNTKAVEFIVENDKVTGVKADYGDQTITYHANKAVILATGGFGSNIEMRKANNPAIDEKFLSTNSVGSMGDGLIMADAIGAELVDLSFIQTYPTCDVETGALLYVGDVRMEGRAILVNKEGNRFVEELERRDVISNATIEQTGSVSYLFWDEASMVASKVNVKHADEYNNLIERGMMVKADTIEEAAAFFEIDADALKATVDRYNGFANAGKDEDFNKRGELVPFTEGPYYIMKSTPAVHHTMGGVRINPEAQVLNTNGDIISGLYAAGEVTGDIHGTNRLGSNAIADIVVFGRIAGANAAQEKAE